VIEEYLPNNFYRKNNDIYQYNKIALETLEPLGVQINDLYSIALKFPKNYYLDGVHFDENGSIILAKSISQKIINTL